MVANIQSRRGCEVMRLVLRTRGMNLEIERSQHRRRWQFSGLRAEHEWLPQASNRRRRDRRQDICFEGLCVLYRAAGWLRRVCPRIAWRSSSMCSVFVCGGWRKERRGHKEAQGLYVFRRRLRFHRNARSVENRLQFLVLPQDKNQSW